MPDPPRGLVGWLRTVAPELDATGIAEAIWLAAAQSAALDRGSGPAAAQVPAGAATAASASAEQQAPSTSPPDAVQQLHDASEEAEAESTGRRVRVRHSRLLPRPLELARSLRPFKTPWRTGRRSQLDLDATVRDYARVGQLIPAFVPAPERWFDAVLVVDESPSMAVWSDVIGELTKLLQQLGAFRTVQTWRLTATENGPVLRDHRDRPTPADRLCPAGVRRLVLVVSDCSAPAWRRPAMWRALRGWSASASTTLLNPLPAKLWRQTGLDLPGVRVGPGTPGTRNTGLRYGVPLLLQTQASQWTPLPAVSLTPHSLGRWARTVMRGDPGGCDAVLIPAQGRLDASSADGGHMTGAQLVQTFQLVASPAAVRLAVFCAPYQQVSLPLLNLIRQELVPEATVSDLAEVVIGLFNAVTEAGQPPILRPRPGVQERLREMLGAQDAWRMYAVLSNHVASSAGLPAGFAAVIYDPTGDVRLPAGLHPFAEATRDTLRLLGAMPGGAPADPERSPEPDDEPEEEGRPEIWNLPSTNLTFSGREELLRELRERLTQGSKVSVLPFALHGMGGVGKTQLALEYARRHADSYDVVWWVPAEDGASARQSLRELGRRLGLPEAVDQQQAAMMLLDALAASPLRWLLIYDSANDPDDLAHLIPSVGGHVILTSRNLAWSDVWSAVEVDVFMRRESVELVLRRAPHLSPEDADRLADKLGDLPLAMGLAASLLEFTGMPTAEFLALFDAEVRELLSEGRPAFYPVTLIVLVSIALDHMEATDPTAAYLLKLFAHLGSEAISTSLLIGGLSDRVAAHGAIRNLQRSGLADTGPMNDFIQVSRLVQLSLREWIPEQDLGQGRADAWQLLATANPGDPENPATWSLHAQIGPHIAPTGLIDAPGDEARQVILDQIRYLWAIGDYDASRRLGERAVERWPQALGPDAPHTLLATAHLAAALRALGFNERARELAADAYRRMRPVFGTADEYTLAAGRSLAADLRIAGDYVQAYELDQELQAQTERNFGPNHSLTRAARQALTADQRLLGDMLTAHDVDEGLLDADQPETAFALALDLYELGRYEAALNLLHNRPPGHRATLTFANCLRKLGRHDEALRHARENYMAFRTRFGRDHQHTLAATTSYVNTLRATGALYETRELAAEVSEGYRRAFGGRHPLTLAAMVNEAIVLRAAGKDREARALAESALEGLTGALGEQHPHTLCAANNLANDLARAGERAPALALSEQTQHFLRQTRGEYHPYSLVCALNLAVHIRAAGDEERADELHALSIEELVRQLGPEHPEAVTARAGVLIDCDIEPLPI
ncbi:FxSxx-COOH system tetratricopeptide repeat protein [Phytohabitans houttuyneae]|uniref:NB-ARC domain-containing protein n=1 Tax=Phytohabitans houttuyneae TaxID=1076126 RepID=A0A6V8KH21_9ACTN|nr:FxSxx-COOH system tetratricopeptide repeat protein [Phytohabitans houttuyneae]GFJ81399.1 hypothetical protein Phou_055790 [Phytohabitans houttuyneae]